MSYNSFGKMFRVTTWGESHGPAIGCVIDGAPPLLELSEADIQPWLDRRRPGTSRFVTQRRESDQVQILSGVYQGKTTGTPISLQIENVDQRPKDYGNITNSFRPGHADYTYHAKYGIRDPRGGGRASARETACRVAAGAVARKVLAPNITIRGALRQLGEHRISDENWDWNEVENNPFNCPDADKVALWEDYLDNIRKAGSSVGAIIEVHASGVPVGWGAPIYGKLDADLAAGMMSINAVKGVEIGSGFKAATLLGAESADEMLPSDDGPSFSANHNGGVLGGISSGQDIVVRFVVKATSSILTPRNTIDTTGNATEVRTKGRHDPCVGIRAVPVGEAMMACVLTDHMLRHRAQSG